jgi:hypothetical protein
MDAAVERTVETDGDYRLIYPLLNKTAFSFFESLPDDDPHKLPTRKERKRKQKARVIQPSLWPVPNEAGDGPDPNWR